MNEETRRHFKRVLETGLDELRAASSAAAQKRKPVQLDQQSVGRLSRQDALQQQAMQQAQESRRHVQALKIAAALRRIDEDEFGYCNACGDDIAHARLEIDPTIMLCVACAS